MRVLLTYDEPIVAALIEAVLRIDDMDVVLTHTPEEARTALARGTFDLHVLDARVPLETDEAVTTLRLAGREYASTEIQTNELRLPFDAESLVRRVRLLSSYATSDGASPDGHIEAEGTSFPMTATWTDEDGAIPLSRQRPESYLGPARHRVVWYADRRR